MKKNHPRRLPRRTVTKRKRGDYDGLESRKTVVVDSDNNGSTNGNRTLYLSDMDYRQRSKTP